MSMLNLSVGRPFSRPRPALYKALGCFLFFIKSLHSLSFFYLNFLNKICFALCPPYSPRGFHRGRACRIGWTIIKIILLKWMNGNFQPPVLPLSPKGWRAPRIFRASLRANAMSKKFVFILFPFLLVVQNCDTWLLMLQKSLRAIIRAPALAL